MLKTPINPYSIYGVEMTVFSKNKPPFKYSVIGSGCARAQAENRKKNAKSPKVEK